MRRAEILIPALFAVCLFGFDLGERGLWASHEARAAQHARMMLDTGDWMLPRLYDGTVDLQKPPGYYWLVALAGLASGGGIDAAVVRAPAAAGGVLCVLFVSAFLSRRGRPTAALIAGLGLATFVHFTGLGRVARIDMTLACAVAGGLLAFAGGRPVLGWVAFAGAVLLKGPVGLALPAAVLIVVRLSNGRKLITNRVHAFLIGPVVFALTALPWFVLADRATGGGVIENFLWYHNVERALGGAETLASYPWWYYGPRLALDSLPWTPSLLLLTVWMTRRRLWSADAEARLGLTWAVVMFVVLSCCSFKRADYLAPLYPGLAIVLGCAAENWLAGRSARVRVRCAAMFGVTVVAVAGGWIVYERGVVPGLDARQDPGRFAGAVRSLTPGPVTFFRVENHALTFHMGGPVHTVLEWAELRRRLAEPGPHFVIMPAELAEECRDRMSPIGLTIFADSREFLDRPRRPLLMLRTDP